MRTFLYYGLLLICSLSVNVAHAQKKYSTQDARAIRFFESALSNYNARQDDKALEAINEALQADPNFIEPYLLQANIYTDALQPQKAIDAYKQVVRINPDFSTNTYYLLGKLEFLVQQYDSSYVHLEKFTLNPKASENFKSIASRIMASCRFAQLSIKNPVKFDPVNMGESINSSHHEYFPAITADGTTFLFTRRIKSGGVGQRTTDQEDFYISKKVNKEWQPALPVTEINTSGNEGAPTLSADGQYLFFTSCEELYSENDARPTKGSCDLFIAKKVGDKFNGPRNLEEPVNSGAWESQPSFSSDGRTLYFVRAIKGSDGKKQRDIYVTRIDDFSNWSVPQPLSATINTPFDELSVFVHPDDQTLYFSSDGHPGMGGQDIFISRRTPTGDWGVPVNLGYPINTHNDENSLLVSPDGTTGYFASDRNGGRGGLDLYQFELDETLRPRIVTYFKGKVFDAESKKPLSAGFELIDLETKKVVVNSTSNSGNGEFIVCLPTGKRYALNVSKDGYLFYSENFELKDPKSSSDPVLRDVPLKPIKVGETVVLKNIFFEFNKYDLKEESKVELNKMATFLTKNPKLNVEIGGHTDNIGGKVYNQQLSEKRARAVLDYLVSNGIAAARLTSKGYGDTIPMADNSTEQGRAQNRRTEFKIISVN
jgi:outer membrane protein OmpA-like peptidoglycan-associated protein/Tol biopolymer transport system component